jgi:hypothetical protein
VVLWQRRRGEESAGLLVRLLLIENGRGVWLWCCCCSVLAARSRGGEMAWFAARTKERGAATDGSQVDFVLGGEREMW